MGILAGIVIAIGLLLSRVLAVLVNAQLWLWFLARKPRGSRTAEYASQIYLPWVARKGFWPGLLLFSPIMGLGMAIGDIDRNGALFTVGMSIAVVGAVLGTGAIWSFMGAVYPNQKLAETRVGLLTTSLERDSTTEPLSSYRRFWRASYLWELIDAGRQGVFGPTVATYRRMQDLLKQFEVDTQAALSALPTDDKLRSAVEKLQRENQTAISDLRRHLGEVAATKKDLIEKWPSGLSDSSVLLRIVQLKPSYSIEQLGIDDIDLAKTMLERKSDSTIVLSELPADALEPNPAKKWSAPSLSEFDVICPVTRGVHKLTIRTISKPSEHRLEITENRTVALVSLDVYADEFTVEFVPRSRVPSGDEHVIV